MTSLVLPSDLRHLKVGDLLWFFDGDRRVYARDEKGRAVGGPIWREHWVPMVVLAESPVAWWMARSIHSHLIGEPTEQLEFVVAAKLLKGRPLPGGWAFGSEHIDEMAWVQQHRPAISCAVSRCDDPAILRQVAALVGWSPEKGQP